MVVYWCDVEDESLTPHVQKFEEGQNQLTLLLEFCQRLRLDGKSFVTSASLDSSAGSIVRDGKLPNGEPYTWKKRRL